MASSSSSSGPAGGGALSDEGATAMAECIGFLFGQWAALQMAVRHRWGSGNSHAKADQLAASVLTWFTHGGAKGAGPLDQDELEDLLCDAMDEYFHADLEDGSIEEVAKHLMIMYTRCMRQNYSYINKLRKTRLAGSVITQSKKIMPRYSESSDDDDDEKKKHRWSGATTRGHPSPSLMRMGGPPSRLGGAGSSISIELNKVTKGRTSPPPHAEFSVRAK